MKQINSAEQVAALHAAIEEMERNRAAAHGSTSGGPPHPPEPSEPPTVPSKGAKPVGDVVEDMARRRAALRRVEADQFEVLARKSGMPAEVVAHYVGSLRPQPTTEWPFIMLSPAQNSAVLHWIMDHSERPKLAVKMWGHLFEVLRHDTGEVRASRTDLATYLGTEPRHVSRIITELASINALRREKRGREVVLYLNSNVATHLPGEALKRAAREADGPLLTVVAGGKVSD